MADREFPLSEFQRSLRLIVAGAETLFFLAGLGFALLPGLTVGEARFLILMSGLFAAMAGVTFASLRRPFARFLPERLSLCGLAPLNLPVLSDFSWRDIEGLEASRWRLVLRLSGGRRRGVPLHMLEREDREPFVAALREELSRR